MPLIEVSNGDVLDKWTILRIKYRIMTNKDALANIEKETLAIMPIVNLLMENNSKVFDLTDKLWKINSELWKIEDDLREHERLQNFDYHFVQLARSVYKLNDARAGIKREINMLTNSSIVEEKSYEKY